MNQSTRRSERLRRNELVKSINDGGEMRIRKTMNAPIEIQAETAEQRYCLPKSACCSSSQLKKMANAFQLSAGKNVSRRGRGILKSSSTNNTVSEVFRDNNSGMYISKSTFAKRVREYKKFIDCVQSKKEWTKDIPPRPNIESSFKPLFLKISEPAFEFKDDDLGFNEVCTRGLTTGEYSLVLKQQRQIVNMGLKLYNRQFVNKYDHLKLKDFKFSFEDLFEKLPNLDKKFLKTKKILLCLEEEYRRIACSNESQNNDHAESFQESESKKSMPPTNTQACPNNVSNAPPSAKKYQATSSTPVVSNKPQGPTRSKKIDEKIKKRIEKANQKEKQQRNLDRNTHSRAKSKQKSSKQGQIAKVTTRKQEKKDIESRNKMKDLYCFMKDSTEHADNPEEAKEAELSSKEDSQTPKLLIANGYFSDCDHIALEQSTNPAKYKSIDKNIDYDLSEPEYVPKRLFADCDALKDMEFTQEQRRILGIKEISENLAIKVALFKCFIYICKRVKVLRAAKQREDRKGRKRSEEIYLQNRDKLKYKLNNRLEKSNHPLSKPKQKCWATAHRDKVRGTCKKIAECIFYKHEEDYDYLIDLQDDYIEHRKLESDDLGVYHFTKSKTVNCDF